MIPEYADDLDFENRLPIGQAPIMTQAVKRFHACMQFMMQSREETGYATMGVVTGDAGVGKTIAIQTYLQSLTPRAYSGFPACVSIKVSPRSTAKAVAKTLLTTLGGERSGHNVYDMEAVASEAIRRNDLDLILVDEGDWLNVESFELLRSIFDRTGCPIVIVGLPRILRVINRHEKFVSRVGLHMEFQPLTQEEVLTTVLPALIIPYWRYQADNPADRAMGTQLWQRVCPSFRKLRADRAMGTQLWQRVCPSFRKLRVVLQYASQVARARQAECITPDILAETLRLTQIPQISAPRNPPQRLPLVPMKRLLSNGPHAYENEPVCAARGSCLVRSRAGAPTPAHPGVFTADRRVCSAHLRDPSLAQRTECLESHPGTHVMGHLS